MAKAEAVTLTPCPRLVRDYRCVGIHPRQHKLASKCRDGTNERNAVAFHGRMFVEVYDEHLIVRGSDRPRCLRSHCAPSADQPAQLISVGYRDYLSSRSICSSAVSACLCVWERDPHADNLQHAVGHIGLLFLASAMRLLLRPRETTARCSNFTQALAGLDFGTERFILTAVSR